MFQLHYIPGSAAMAPHAALAEVGVEYQLMLVQRNDAGESPPAYLALNPSGRVPTLVAGDLVLSEAAAILLYLADGFPDARLLPPVGTVDRAECYRWLVFLTNTVQTTMMRFFYPDRYGTEGVEEIAQREADALFARIDGHLVDRNWLVGSERTIADLFLFMVTRWGRRLASPAWDRPHLRGHWLRSLEVPGVRRMLIEQELELPEFAHPR